MSKLIWPLLLFGCAAILVLLRDTDQAEISAPTTALISQEPDLYLEDAVITQYQDDGTLSYELASTRIRHFEGRNLSRLDNPDLQMHQTDNPPWNARADEGEIRNREDPEHLEQAEVVHLRHNVLLEQTRGESFTRLKSDDLTIYPDRRYAETDQAVMIDTNAGRTKAVGLEADLERSVLELSSTETQRVHSIVLPFQFKP